jgi:hypothetical protein
MTMRENKIRVIPWCRWEALVTIAALICFQISLSTANSDCTEPEIPFPVQFTREDVPGSKAYLTKTIRKNVLTGSTRIQDGSQDVSLSMLSNLLDKEYRCNTGVALSTKEAGELLAILHQIYQEILNQGGVKPRTSNRLSSLQEEVNRRGSHSANCSKAASELAQLVIATTKEALTEKEEYETALRQRETRIDQCRKVALAGEQSNKAAAEVRRKQDAIELQKAEEQKLRAEIDRKRQQEDLERQEKEAQKEQKLKAEAEALELHKTTLALQKEREAQLKAEAEAHKRQTEELERQKEELRRKIERDRQLEAEKDRQKEVQRQIAADRERKVKEDREREVEAAKDRQKQVQDEIAAEKARQAEIRAKIEESQSPPTPSPPVQVVQPPSQPKSEPKQKPTPGGKPVSEITWSEVQSNFGKMDPGLTSAQREKLQKERKQLWQADYRGKWVRWGGSVNNVSSGGSKVKIDMGEGSWGSDVVLIVAPDSKGTAAELDKDSYVTFVGRMSEQPGALTAMELQEVTIE